MEPSEAVSFAEVGLAHGTAVHSLHPMTLRCAATGLLAKHTVFLSPWHPDARVLTGVGDSSTTGGRLQLRLPFGDDVPLDQALKNSQSEVQWIMVASAHLGMRAVCSPEQDPRVDQTVIITTIMFI